MKASIAKDERQKIKDDLKFGDITITSQLSGKSKSTVKRWLANETDCFEIPEAINTLYKSRQKTM